MATSSIGTNGSGIDIPTLVSTLVAKARAPAQARINSAGTAATTKLSAIAQIKSGLTNLQTSLGKVVSSAGTDAYKATVQADAGFTATTTDSAVVGSYAVEVVKLAAAQKLSSGAYAADATVGSGTLTFAYGDTSFTVDISGTDKLSDIAAAINKAAGGKGVNASVVTANDGQHLVLNAAETGTQSALTITASNNSLQALTYGANLTGGLTQTIAATDAVVRVDGFERTSSNNTVANLVPGVVLTLTKAAEGSKFNLSINTDNSAIKASLTAFTAAYNTANTLLKSSSAYNADTKKASALTGDALVRSLQQQLRGQVSDNLPDLKALGISLDKDGVMSFDGTALDNALSKDPNAASSLLGKDGKFGASMTKLLETQLNSTSGTLTLRQDSLNKQVSGLTDQLNTLDERMNKLSDQYTAQFTAMETMITQMQSSASSLSSLLAS